MLYVKFFASLGESVGRNEVTLSDNGPVSLARVWEQATGGMPMPDNTLCALNQEYARLDEVASDGDEVAFFPPVTGG